MSWRTLEHITIYREAGWYAAHPNVVRTPGGDLLALFHRSPDTGHPNHDHPLFDVRACRSSDDGGAWSAAKFVSADPLGGVLDFGTHTLPDSSVFLHAATSALIAEGHWPTREPSYYAVGGKPFWIRSCDDGKSWTEPVRFPPLPDALWGYPAANSGVCRSGLVALPGGRLLLPGKATDHPDGKMPYFGTLLISDDVGETWRYGGRIAEDLEVHFSEPAIHVTPSGRILILFRCHPPGRLYSGHPGMRLGLVYSDDGGQTWSPWRWTNIREHPAHLLRLRDGRIFLTVGTRWVGQRGCIARVLDPEGGDLETAPDWVIRSDSHGPEGWDCGYPWAVELRDGKVLVVYYYVHPDGVRGIEGTVVEEV